MERLEQLIGEIGPERPQFWPDSRIRKLASRRGSPVKDVIVALLRHDIWPERFRRNCGVISANQQSALLSMRVFIAGAGGLGGEVASLLARLGVGSFRICDPDVFEESNLNRQCFCREKSIGKLKAEIAKTELLAIASWLEIEALTIVATPENLPELLTGMDVAIDCLDSVPRKKMLERAASAAHVAYLHGSVLHQDGFIYLDNPGQNRLACLYPDIQAAEKSLGANPVLATTVTGTAVLMVSLLLDSLILADTTAAPLLHLDLSVPELENFLL